MFSPLMCKLSEFEFHESDGGDHLSVTKNIHCCHLGGFTRLMGVFIFISTCSFMKLTYEVPEEQIETIKSSAQTLTDSQTSEITPLMI